jgi:ribose transport system ATP-binding protein
MSATRPLVATGLTKSFSGITVVRDVDLEVMPGEVLCLLGENGAGKSTVAKMLAGVVRPDSGSMTLGGEEYSPHSPAAAIDAGVGLIHQETNLVPHLSIAENVFLGRQPTRGGRIDMKYMRQEAQRNLHRLGADLDPDAPVSSLSVAGLQKVEIAKALALNAQFLLLDEPTAALGYDDAEQLFRVVEQLAAEGVGFVFISHRLEEISRIGSRILVMRDSRRVNHFDRADIDQDTLVEAMVDRPIDRVFPDPEPHAGREILKVDGISRTGSFSNVSFELHEERYWASPDLSVQGAPKSPGHFSVPSQRKQEQSRFQAGKLPSGRRGTPSRRASRWFRRTGNTRDFSSNKPSLKTSSQPRWPQRSPGGCSARARSKRSWGIFRRHFN